MPQRVASISKIGGLVLAIALFFSACSGSGSSDAQPNDGPAEPSMAASSPLGALFVDNGGFDATFAAYIQQVDEAIFRCMAEQGFEFALTESFVDESQRRAQELTVRAWTTEFGFGISTALDSFDPRESTDPNTPIVMSLSGPEQELWREALVGKDFNPEPGGTDPRPLDQQGCVGQGFINTGGREVVEGMQQFGSTYEEQIEALLDRAEVVDAVQDWSRCMSEAGRAGFGDLDAPEEHIRARLEALTQSVFEALPDISDEEKRAWFAGEWEGEGPDFGTSLLLELQTEEIQLALADLDCYESDVAAVYEPLRDALENGLIEEYSDAFNALTEVGE